MLNSVVGAISSNLCRQLSLTVYGLHADIITAISVFFTSDTHFGDHRTINISRRPFANASEITEELIKRWNVVVGMEDVVWHLGRVDIVDSQTA